MRKNLIITVFLIVSIVIFKDFNLNTTSQASNYYEDTNQKKYEVLTTYADMIDYDYNSLKEVADVIAVVKIEDTLDEANARIYYDDTGEYIVGFSQIRKAKVIKYYKNDFENSDIISISEPTALYEGKVLLDDGYTPLRADSTYLVFLDYMENTKELSVISGGKSIVPLDDINSSYDLDIAYKSLIDFGSNIKNKKSIISEDKLSMHKKSKKNKKHAKVSISNYEFDCYYSQSEEGYHVEIQEE